MVGYSSRKVSTKLRVCPPTRYFEKIKTCIFQKISIQKIKYDVPQLKGIIE